MIRSLLIDTASLCKDISTKVSMCKERVDTTPFIIKIGDGNIISVDIQIYRRYAISNSVCVDFNINCNEGVPYSHMDLGKAHKITHSIDISNLANADEQYKEIYEFITRIGEWYMKLYFDFKELSRVKESK